MALCAARLPTSGQPDPQEVPSIPPPTEAELEPESTPGTDFEPPGGTLALMQGHDLGSELAAALGEPLGAGALDMPPAAPCEELPVAPSVVVADDDEWPQDVVEDLDEPVLDHVDRAVQRILLGPEQQRWVLRSRALLAALQMLTRQAWRGCEAQAARRARVGMVLSHSVCANWKSKARGRGRGRKPCFQCVRRQVRALLRPSCPAIVAVQRRSQSCSPIPQALALPAARSPPRISSPPKTRWSPGKSRSPRKRLPTRIVPPQRRPPESGLDLFALSPEMPADVGLGMARDAIPPLALPPPREEPSVDPIPIPSPRTPSKHAHRRTRRSRSGSGDSWGSPLAPKAGRWVWSPAVSPKVAQSRASSERAPAEATVALPSARVYAPRGWRRPPSVGTPGSGSRVSQSSADLLARLAELNQWQDEHDAFFDQVDLSDEEAWSDGSGSSWLSDEEEALGMIPPSTSLPSQLEPNPFDMSETSSFHSSSSDGSDPEDGRAEEEWEQEHRQDPTTRREALNLRGFGRVAHVNAVPPHQAASAKLPKGYTSFAQPAVAPPQKRTTREANQHASEVTSTAVPPSLAESTVAPTVLAPAPQATSARAATSPSIPSRPYVPTTKAAPPVNLPTSETPPVPPPSPPTEIPAAPAGPAPHLRPTSVDWHGLLASSSGMRARSALAQNPFAQWRASPMNVAAEGKPKGEGKSRGGGKGEDNDETGNTASGHLCLPNGELGDTSTVSTNPSHTPLSSDLKQRKSHIRARQHPQPHSHSRSRSHSHSRSRTHSHRKLSAELPPPLPSTPAPPPPGFTLRKAPGASPLYVYTYKYGNSLAPGAYPCKGGAGSAKPYGAFSFAHGTGWPGPGSSVPPSPAVRPIAGGPGVGVVASALASSTSLRSRSGSLASNDSDTDRRLPSHGSVSTLGSASSPGEANGAPAPVPTLAPALASVASASASASAGAGAGASAVAAEPGWLRALRRVAQLSSTNPHPAFSRPALPVPAPTSSRAPSPGEP